LTNKGLKLSKIFSAQNENVKIDRDEFIQSVTNLMRNSLQSLIEAYKGDRSAKGYLKLTTSNKNGKLIILVEDNGLGIKSEDCKKLFKVNFTTKSSEDGTGLGLSISRRFIRSYDGDIRYVASESNTTQFEIVLPLVDVESKGKAVA